MPTDDRQILVTGTADAPADWLVPGNGQIRPKVVHAVYDGTSASGNFIPVLQVISDAGVVVGEYVAPTVAAGASVAQSWFPHVAEQTAGAGATGVFELDNVDPTAVGAGAAVFMPWTFITGTNMLDHTDPTKPLVTTKGIYSVAASMTVLTNATTRNEFSMDLMFSLPTAVNSHMEQSGYSATLTYAPQVEAAWTVVANVGDYFRIKITNLDSASRNFASDNVTITRIT